MANGQRPEPGQPQLRFEPGSQTRLPTQQGQAEEKSYVAEAINPMETDIELVSQMAFAEDAQGGPGAWRGIANVALNRVKDGRYGKNLKEVVNKMSSAIRTKSPQWLKASKGEFNDYEWQVYQRIKQEVAAAMAEGSQDNTGGAVLFENIDRFGFPKSWDKSKVQAVAKIGNQTYFRER